MCGREGYLQTGVQTCSTEPPRATPRSHYEARIMHIDLHWRDGDSPHPLNRINVQSSPWEHQSLASTVGSYDEKLRSRVRSGNGMLPSSLLNSKSNLAATSVSIV